MIASVSNQNLPEEKNGLNISNSNIEPNQNSVRPQAISLAIQPLKQQNNEDPY